MAEPDDPFDRIVATLKEPVRIPASVTARVMREIAGLPAPGPGPLATESPLGWSRRRWTIRLSPLGGLALAAGLTAVVVAGSRLVARPGEADPPPAIDVAAPTATTTSRIQFVLVAPGAASVTVVGDFNDWNVSATPLEKAEGDGIWWITVPLAPGRYRYSFVVDGTKWLSDPQAPAGENEFGRPNSVVTIGGP